ncbi:MAG: AbrB/MazE/SpoVT family DNA-binding domain-containing protein [Melioribacteraceae bacterium]|nr:AbrB/MazE/SpoVT family DNA-binding domain-containing protein [Melioribacteraceae bacterium]
MNTVVVTTKGQVVIPAKFRKKFGIKIGTKIQFIEEDGEIKLFPITEEAIDNNIGFLGTKGELLKTFMREKKIEREL